eukprot:1033608-Pyramimonas_sp.AAC.1
MIAVSASAKANDTSHVSSGPQEENLSTCSSIAAFIFVGVVGAADVVAGVAVDVVADLRMHDQSIGDRDYCLLDR